MIPGGGACSLASVASAGQPIGSAGAAEVGGPVGAGASPVLDELRKRFARVAVVHDWLTVPGGSEQVVLELLEMFPQAELFTSVYDPAPWPVEITERAVHSSFLSHIPGATRHYQKLLPLMNAAFRSFDLSGFDLVLSSSHACAKNVRTPPGTLHVCYCHTPMRYAWEEGFLAGEEFGRAMGLALPPLLAWLRRVDRAGASGPDVFVANSRHVAERIQRYYGRTAEIVNPPVDVEHFLGLERRPGERTSDLGDAGGAERAGRAGDYYFAFGRVVPYKRVDLAVAACARLGRPLKVAGDGRALDAVRATAGGGAVEFLGKVDADERDRLLAGARALLFPGEEDFGIVPVEAQAAGLPVIAYGVGGAAETVLDGRTGVLFGEQSAGALARAIERFESLTLNEEMLRENARRFGRERFRAELAGVIDRASRRLA
jgi:glycosyltransferase involved in cell wall biosynthesis